MKKPGGPEGGLAHEIFYVPQRPYVTMGTLQDQLIYPVERSGESLSPLLPVRLLIDEARNAEFSFPASQRCTADQRMHRPSTDPLQIGSSA